MSTTLPTAVKTCTPAAATGAGMTVMIGMAYAATTI
jgi:hypothetical protein